MPGPSLATATGPTRLSVMWLSVLGDLTGSLVEGNVYRYEDQLLSPNVIQYRRVGMWTPADAPARGSPGKGTSSVSIDLHMSRTAAERPGLIQVCLLYTSPSPRDQRGSRMPSSA